MKTLPRIFRVLFPHGNYEINENTGIQNDIPMVDMGLLKINDENVKPSYNLWVRTAKPSDFPRLYFHNKNAGFVKNFDEFEKTTLRAERQPELIWFKQESIAMWEGAE